MGIFGKKKNIKSTTVSEVKTSVVSSPKKVIIAHNAGAILRPRVTEKSALLSEKNVYTFEVRKGATKYEVRDAIKALYKVTPASVNIVNKQPRHSMSRATGRDKMEHGLRKAYVYLKKGDRIELV